MKITIHQLKNYLGTDIKILRDFQGNIFTSKMTHFNMMNLIDDDYSGKLIVYRLSDLDKKIEVDGEMFVPVDEIDRIFLPNTHIGSLTYQGVLNPFTPYGIVQKLFEWHFWPFGDDYFEQGLVIDKAKL